MASAFRPSRPVGLSLSHLRPGLAGVASGVSLNSREVEPGDLYVALPGQRAHGAAFAAQAVERGAVAVMTDADGAALLGDCAVPVITVDDPRRAMGPVAAEAYGWPSRSLEMFGVTGTNGKTSTVFLLEAALAALGRRVATIGTIGFRIAGEQVESSRGTVTTPDAPDLQGMLAAMVERGISSVAMEVSSHALALHRVGGVGFDVAAFTMFGQDHLDFHPTLEDYFQAKAQLFLGGWCRVAVVNIGDEAGRRLAELVRADGRPRLVTVGGLLSGADYQLAFSHALPGARTGVGIATPHGLVTYELSMLGDFNVRNSLTALAMVGAAGLDVQRAAQGLAEAQVPGRMQRVPLGDGAPQVVVDFAHTPQAVTAALSALPTTGRRIVVLGAGGDRDATKREPMGAAAASLADVVIVTDDNPRTEDPATIRAAVLAGARSVGRPDVTVIDARTRRDAIEQALSMASGADWVAILGKGHEKTQTVGTVVSPFDDVEVALTWAASNERH